MSKSNAPRILHRLTPWERREYLDGIRARYENGETIRSIANGEGVAYQNVHYWLQSVLGIQLRKRGNKLGIKFPNRKTQATTVQA